MCLFSIGQIGDSRFWQSVRWKEPKDVSKKIFHVLKDGKMLAALNSIILMGPYFSSSAPNGSSMHH